HIKRSLSAKGCPYDNAVAEATYKIFKTEFVRHYHFEADYVHWYNYIRIHGTLGYMSPVQYKRADLKKVV
uniref:IS3 family transposase n=1 Tax=Longirhabdus pacifica TaxID=2305227 RepID=UPI0013E8AAD7